MRVLTSLLALVFAGICITSCVNENFTLGGDNLSTNMRTILVDTCTVEVTVVQADSIVTSGLNVGWVGNYNDPLFGEITSSTLFAFAYPDYSTYTDTEFDSATFVFKSATDFYGDTNHIETFAAYKLTQKLELNDYGYLCNTSNFEREQTPLFTYSYKPKPHKSLTHEIRLPDAYGKELLEKFMEDDYDINTEENFLEYFKGFELVPESGQSTNINSISVKDSSIIVRLYFHYNDGNRNDQLIEICADPALQYNKVTYDRSGTQLEKFTSKTKEISSKDLGNQIFMQRITGLSAIINFPYLNNFQLLGDYVGIQSASLSLMPIKGSFTYQTPLPDSVALKVLNEADEIISTGKALVDKDNLYYDQNTKYTMALTSLMQDQLGTMGIDKKRILMNLPNTGTAAELRRLVAGDNYNEKKTLKLKLTLQVYDDK